MSKDTNGRTQTRRKTRNVSKRIFMKTRFSTQKNKRQVGISLDPEDFCHFSSNQMDFPQNYLRRKRTRSKGGQGNTQSANFV